MFERYESFLIDVSDSKIIDYSNGKVYHFDFSNMTMRCVTSKKYPSPLRYDEQNDMLLVWRDNNWRKLGNECDSANAAMKLFKLIPEYELLIATGEQ